MCEAIVKNHNHSLRLYLLWRSYHTTPQIIELKYIGPMEQHKSCFHMIEMSLVLVLETIYCVKQRRNNSTKQRAALFFFSTKQRRNNS